MTEPAVERRVITAVFVDVVGSTALTADLGPERLKRALDRAFTSIKTLITAEGGVVEKYIGDAIYALFGAPTAHADDPQRALRAAHACLRWADAGDASAVQLAVRIGLETGEAIVDLTASETAHQQMSVGACVNLAARLQQLAEPGEALVGPVCHAENRETAEFVPLGDPEIQGMGRVAVWRLVDLRSTPVVTRLPLVGRTSEMDLLRLAYGRARSRRSVLVLVSGSPGQGKTRLVQEFVTGVAPGAHLLTARCRPAGERDARNPLQQLLTDVDGAMSPELLDARLSLLFTDTQERQRVFAAMAHSAGLSVNWELADLPADQRLDEIANGWRRYFTGLARDRPLVVWVDDLHWADDAVVQLLDRLTLGAEIPLMVIGTARPEISLHSGLRPGGDRFFLALDGLDASEAQLLARHAGSGDTPGLDRAEGNPLFILELARARAISASAEIPITLQGVIGARLDELPTDDRELLQRAAVAGDTFTLGDASLLSGREASAIQPALERLADRQYLQRVPDGHRFHHALVRDVAYGRLTTSERMHLHARYAREGIGEDNAEGRAHHLWEAVGQQDADWVWEGQADFAGLRALAHETHLAAARRYAATFAYQRALEACHRAFRFSSAPQDTALVEEATAEVYAARGEPDEAAAHYLRARDLYRQRGLEAAPTLYPGLLELPIYTSGMFRRPLPEALIEELLHEGEAVVRRSGDVASLTRLLALGAYRSHDAARLVEALQLSERVSDLTPLALCLKNAAILQNRLGDFDVAGRTYERLDALAAATGPTDRQLEFRAILALNTGEIARAQMLASQFVKVSASRGPHLRTHAQRELGHVLLARGDWAGLRALAVETEQLVSDHPQTAFCYAVTTVQAFASIADVVERRGVEARSLLARAELPLQAEPFERESVLLLLYATIGNRDAVDALLATVRQRGDSPFWFFHRMAAVAFTMLERWDHVDEALAAISGIAGKDSPYFIAFIAATREEMAAARGGPPPRHTRLRELGYLGWSQLLSHRQPRQERAQRE